MNRYGRIDPMTHLARNSPDVHALLQATLNTKNNAIHGIHGIHNKVPSEAPSYVGPPGNFVSVILRNGLGNRIIQLLAAIGYAERYKKICVLSQALVTNGIKPHEKGLEGMLTRIFPNLPVINSIQQYTVLREQKEMNYSPLPRYESNVVLQGYFQDEKYFPSKPYIPVIRTAYYENTFFIHIRAGDYLYPGSFGLNLVEYHKHCIANIDSSLGEAAKFIVFSNDNVYADNYMKQFGIKYTISNKVNPLETLIEMANCAGGICANSTFSWLGAFFQREPRGKIFMPSVWLKGRDCRGIYPTWARVINIENGLHITSIPEDVTPIKIIDNQPITQVNTPPKNVKTTYNLSDITILNLPSGRRLNYNACIVDNRIFFRAVNQVERDDIVTCILDNFNYVRNSMKTLSLVSKFNNKHVEDPRVILHNGNWFVCYTDGYDIGIAKLDANCNTLYSHYLKKPSEISFEGGDGREKNWLPISMGDKIHFWYGDNPRTFLIYEDTGKNLQYNSYIKTEQRIKSNFGGIRGGCPPIQYDEETQIWFFHTLFEKQYRIGAYLTKGVDVISITPKPILTGNHIVFPCGAIQRDGYFYISMGVQDKYIGILKVSRDLEFVPI